MLLAVGKASVPMLNTTRRMLRDFDTYGILVAPKDIIWEKLTTGLNAS